MADMLLDVRSLSLGVKTDESLELVDNVSFHIQSGEVYGLVGESGCGKSVTSMAILGLLPNPGGFIKNGEIIFAGENLLSFSEEKLQSIRGNEISVIFQEPSSAMNPLYTIGQQLEECFDYHSFSGDKQKTVEELLKKVGLRDTQRVIKAFPHQLSGGMLQRCMIAMALLLKPKLIIADEPTTALDVTIQAQIMELLMELKNEMETSILLITHNLGLIAQYADRLGIMYAGRLVEECNVNSFLKNSAHPYAHGLVRAIPDISSNKTSLIPIPGQVPHPRNYAKGCRFKERCEHASEKCLEKPELTEIYPEHRVACFNPLGN